MCLKIALQKLWSAQPFQWRIQEEEREKADFYTSQHYVAVILEPEGGHELGVMHGKSIHFDCTDMDFQKDIFFTSLNSAQAIH